MAQQRHLFEAAPEERRSEPVAVRPLRRSLRTRWLARTELMVRVVVRLYLGLLLFALPWTRYWTENGLLGYTDTLAAVASNGFVRGVVSGLGVLNVALSLAMLFAGEPEE